MIFVVGFAHSGTTFLCEVLGGAGFTFSDPMDHMEDVPLRTLLFNVDAHLLRRKNGPAQCGQFHQPIRDAFARFGQVEVVKQPSFVHCLRVVLDAGVRPSRVLLAHRDLVSVLDALRDYGKYEQRRARSLRIEWMQGEWARTKELIEKEGIPFGIVRFPRSVEDVDEIPAALTAADYVPTPDLRLALEDAWAKWRDPKRVHFQGP